MTWPEARETAVALLSRGKCVAFPTETVYGLGARFDDAAAVAQIFVAKGRPADKPLIVHVVDEAGARAVAGAWPEAAARLAAAFWPGPLTLVLPRRPGLGYALGEPATTIGVRCPDHRLVRDLAAVTGPLATTSANVHGEPTPATASGVADLFGPGLALVLDGGPCSAPPSTVVAVDPAGWRVLREGPLTAADIEAAATA